MNNDVSCKDVMKHVCESLGEDLNSEKCRNIKQHLEECPGCQSYFKSVEKTITFYRDYNVELPDEAHKRLMSMLGLTEDDK